MFIAGLENTQRGCLPNLQLPQLWKRQSALQKKGGQTGANLHHVLVNFADFNLIWELSHLPRKKRQKPNQADRSISRGAILFISLLISGHSGNGHSHFGSSAINKPSPWQSFCESAHKIEGSSKCCSEMGNQIQEVGGVGS